MKNKRELCVGNCGRMVLKGQGECRKCRRARVLAGKRRVAKAGGVAKKSFFVPLFETAKQKFDRVKKEK